MKNKIAFKIIAISGILIFLIFQNLIASAQQKKEGREREMEKAIFIASSAQEKQLQIGLIDCMLFALKNNSEIKIKKIEPLIEEQNIKIEEAGFEPTLDADLSLEEIEEQTYSALAAGYSRTSKFDIGLDGKLPTGTEYNLDFKNKIYKSNLSYQTINPYYKSEAEITITQPLLKDFGTFVNNAEIFVAENSKEKSKQVLQNEVIETISKTKIFYYDYLLLQEQYRLAEISFTRANDLLKIVDERYRQGEASSVELLEAKAGVADREEILLSIEGKVKFAEDNLKLITNLVNEPELWNAQIIPIDRPELKLEDIDLLVSLKEAFEFRPDYKAAKIELESQDIRIKMKENATLPAIDLVATLGLNGLDENYSRAFENLSDGNYRKWYAGVKVGIPLGNKAAMAEYEKSRLLKKQLLVEFERLEQSIILGVRDAVRQTDIVKRKIDTADKRLAVQTKRYEAANSRFAHGLISAHEMLEYEEDLSGSETNYIQALTSYNEAITNLQKTTGTTLAKNNINFIDEGEEIK